MLHALRKLLRPRSAGDYTAELVKPGEVKTALDIGCGIRSPLGSLRPGIRTTGLDAFEDSIRQARKTNLHDHYAVADILSEEPESILSKHNEGQTFDLVAMYGLIEHLPKRNGFTLLDRCEQLTSKYIILETPNGFVPQGPEFGNEFQRHRSGWFIHDFEGLGFTVHGTTGTRFLRGYMAGPRYRFPGCIVCDELLTLFCRINNHPGHAFNLVAIKDVRGVPPRHDKETQS